MRRVLGATAAVAMALLVGCAGPSDTGPSDAESGAVGDVSGADAGGAPVVDSDADRQVVTTGTASLSVDDPAKAAQQVSELVESVGGRVDQRSEQAASGDDGALADLVVRVPADALTGVLADLRDLGGVENVSVSHSDVTATVVDQDARISALRTSVGRLQALIDGAPTTEALLAAEQALSGRQQELESLQSQRALLADQVELSTLDVHLRPYGLAPAGGPDGFGEGLSTGWRALVSTLQAAVVVLAVLLPWIALAGLVTGAVLFIVRLVVRRTTPRPPVPPTSPAVATETTS